MKSASSNIQLLTLPAHKDERGNFIKIFHASHPYLAQFSVNQVNYVTSKLNTLRGLHYQTGKSTESKFFRVLDGAIQLVCFCIDKKNEEFGESFSTVLNKAEDGVLVPKGYATGYLVLTNSATVLYLSDNEYNTDSEKGIRWNDPILTINWDLNNPKISEKDSSWPNFELND